MRTLGSLLFGLLTLAPSPVLAGEGKDFAAEAKLLYRVVACAGDDAVPAHLDAKVVGAYCERLGKSIEKYRTNYVDGASKFIAGIRPADAPKTVVYPFGGGDLLSALTTYPDASLITTMSLEHAGDPRRIHTMKKGRLASSLAVIRNMGGGLLVWNDSKSETLMKAQRNDLPGQISLFLIALATHGYEPVSLRFFRVEPDGSLHYYDEAEIAALEHDGASKLKSNWTPPDFSEAFSHSELTFRKRGGSGELRVHRHLAANLGDASLATTPGVIRYLEKQGRVSAMTKAASYLLWYDSFATIRNYLLANMDFMVSDSTGIPPEYATKAGFEQETYGRFERSFLNVHEKYNAQFRKLWRAQPERPLPFRYGYIDGAKHYHMLITRPAKRG
ncbi:hypothetical protein L6R52_36210 [Myxococcota bacterium]|nr:hypothetical protein [Myxococcota bacterium]